MKEEIAVVKKVGEQVVVAVEEAMEMASKVEAMENI